ncbi:unnamed protein product, partial [Prorocentrum cordatum]
DPPVLLCGLCETLRGDGFPHLAPGEFIEHNMTEEGSAQMVEARNVKNAPGSREFLSQGVEYRHRVGFQIERKVTILNKREFKEVFNMKPTVRNTTGLHKFDIFIENGTTKDTVWAFLYDASLPHRAMKLYNDQQFILSEERMSPSAQIHSAQGMQTMDAGLNELMEGSGYQVLTGKAHLASIKHILDGFGPQEGEDEHLAEEDDDADDGPEAGVGCASASGLQVQAVARAAPQRTAVAAQPRTLIQRSLTSCLTKAASVAGTPTGLPRGPASGAASGCGPFAAGAPASGCGRDRSPLPSPSGDGDIGPRDSASQVGVADAAASEWDQSPCQDQAQKWISKLPVAEALTGKRFGRTIWHAEEAYSKMAPREHSRVRAHIEWVRIAEDSSSRNIPTGDVSAITANLDKLQNAGFAIPEAVVAALVERAKEDYYKIETPPDEQHAKFYLTMRPWSTCSTSMPDRPSMKDVSIAMLPRPPQELATIYKACVFSDLLSKWLACGESFVGVVVPFCRKFIAMLEDDAANAADDTPEVFEALQLEALQVLRFVLGVLSTDIEEICAASESYMCIWDNSKQHRSSSPMGIVKASFEGDNYFYNGKLADFKHILPKLERYHKAITTDADWINDTSPDIDLDDEQARLKRICDDFATWSNALSEQTMASFHTVLLARVLAHCAKAQDDLESSPIGTNRLARIRAFQDLLSAASLAMPFSKEVNDYCESAAAMLKDASADAQRSVLFQACEAVVQKAADPQTKCVDMVVHLGTLKKASESCAGTKLTDHDRENVSLALTAAVRTAVQELGRASADVLTHIKDMTYFSELQVALDVLQSTAPAAADIKNVVSKTYECTPLRAAQMKLDKTKLYAGQWQHYDEVARASFAALTTRAEQTIDAYADELISKSDTVTQSMFVDLAAVSGGMADGSHWSAAGHAKSTFDEMMKIASETLMKADYDKFQKRISTFEK